MRHTLFLILFFFIFGCSSESTPTKEIFRQYNPRSIELMYKGKIENFSIEGKKITVLSLNDNIIGRRNAKVFENILINKGAIITNMAEADYIAPIRFGSSCTILNIYRSNHKKLLLGETVYESSVCALNYIGLDEFVEYSQKIYSYFLGEEMSINLNCVDNEGQVVCL